jgi:octaprenyl-diphosphate synthase
VLADTLIDNARDHSHSLTLLMELLKEDLKMVNELLIQEMQSEVPLIPKLAGHLIAAGGKRIRPLLTIATSRLCGYEGSRHITLAACVEFIHTATLLHDDVVDASALRRGIPSANAVWGNSASVLIGDFLFSRAFQLMVDDGDLEILAILSQAAARITEGEIKQLTTAHNLNLDQETYIELIRAKTGALFEGACEVGAVLAQKTKTYQDALKAYGENLGIAFQLIDDVLDYGASQQELGKTIGDDFKEGKVTLPSILAYAQSSTEEQLFWERTLRDVNQQEQDLNQALAYLRKHNILTQCLRTAQYYGDRAKKELQIFEDSLLKNHLLSLVDFCISRGF